jgi:lipopolysaccharide/colanic/teichoic acid biosynthesis glycosyltransferase
MDVASRKPGDAMARTSRTRWIGWGVRTRRFSLERILKVALEFVLAAVILVGTGPIVAMALLLVRLTSRGPVIYSQKRLGLEGEVFTIYKIRSMYQNSEPAGPRWSLPGDPRVTPVGRLLRWSHVDELPQMINVLRGEMSLIGPRPERPEIVADLERDLPEYRRRLLVRPGLTGLAQVLQPPDADLAMVRRKLDLDLSYLDDWSLWLDVRIVLATVLHLLNVPGATIARLFGFPWEAMGADDTSATSPAAVTFQASPPALSQPCSSPG